MSKTVQGFLSSHIPGCESSLLPFLQISLGNCDAEGGKYAVLYAFCLCGIGDGCVRAAVTAVPISAHAETTLLWRRMQYELQSIRIRSHCHRARQ